MSCLGFGLLAHRMRIQTVFFLVAVCPFCWAIHWQAGSAFTWGISNQTLPILPGQIITEARLVFLNPRAAGKELPLDWNAPDTVDLNDWVQFGRCWGKRTGGLRLDMAFFERLSRFWLKSYCGDCGKTDLTGDQKVDTADLLAAADFWLTEPATECAEWDWNADERISPQDVAFFSEFWLMPDIIRASDDRIGQAVLSVYLLANPRLGFLPSTAAGAAYFASFGTPIRGVWRQGRLEYVFSLNHDPKSAYAVYFGGLVDFGLSDGTTARLSSALLALISAAGSSGSFGFGFHVSEQPLDFDGLYLELTVQSYAGAPYKRVFYFRPVF